MPDDALTAADRQRLQTQFLMEAPEMAAARRELDGLLRSEPRFPTTLVMQERPPQNPRSTFIHHRGEWLKPEQRVEGGEVRSCPISLVGVLVRNRLALARWFVSRDNPLTARVTVNRQWAAIFGRRHRPHDGRLLLAGRPADPPRVAGLALPSASWTTGGR